MGWDEKLQFECKYTTIRTSNFTITHISIIKIRTYLFFVENPDHGRPAGRRHGQVFFFVLFRGCVRRKGNSSPNHIQTVVVRFVQPKSWRHETTKITPKKIFGSVPDLCWVLEFYTFSTSRKIQYILSLKLMGDRRS